MVCGQKLTSTDFSRTSQGSQKAYTHLNISASFAKGQHDEVSDHYSSASILTAGLLKYQPYEPYNDCCNMIGSAQLSGCYGGARLFEKDDFYTC